MTTKDKIREILNQKFKIIHLEIIDDSAKHAGHSADAQRGESHFTLILVSDDFKGMPLVKRHRLVYDALRNELKNQIHALALKTLTSEEI